MVHLTTNCITAGCAFRAVLLKSFMSPSAGSTAADDYEHVAAILTNCTRLQPGRALLLQPGRGLLTALAAQLRLPTVERRRGCAAALRNCCFSAEVGA